MNETTDRPSVDERYTSATNASSLLVTPERACSADVIIAAGWAPSRLGMALLRLASEWDASAKPPTNANAEWLAHEQRLLMGKLKTLPGVRDQVQLYAAKRFGPDKALDIAAAAILHWLDPACRVCDGRKYETVKNTARLSGRHCPACHGSGERKAGITALLVTDYMADCVNRARQQIRRRLRFFADRIE
jgi:mono/diheme cytochrome c family protein